MDNHYELAKEYKKKNLENKKKYLEESKKRLCEIQKKKLQTSFIGSISEFENKFGFLWGFVNKEQSWTDEQIEMKRALNKIGFDEKYFRIWWDEIRNKVLNNGNNQIRGLGQEMETYTVHWDRFNVQLPVQQLNTQGE